MHFWKGSEIEVNSNSNLNYKGFFSIKKNISLFLGFAPPPPIFSFLFFLFIYICIYYICSIWTVCPSTYQGMTRLFLLKTDSFTFLLKKHLLLTLPLSLELSLIFSEMYKEDKSFPVNDLEGEFDNFTEICPSAALPANLNERRIQHSIFGKIQRKLIFYVFNISYRICGIVRTWLGYRLHLLVVLSANMCSFD